MSTIDAHMTEQEIALFTQTLHDCTEYFEYGMGGSTCIAHTTATQAKIVAVDSDSAWVTRVHDAMPASTRLHLVHINIGPTREWGYPKWKVCTRILWPAYSKAIVKFAQSPNVIFIDGRFRVACALQSILLCITRNLRPKILLHDCVREEYSILYSLLKPVEKVESEFEDHLGLQVFEVPKRHDVRVLEKMYRQYAYDPR